MADITDVEQAIISLIAAVVYPNGTGNVSAIIDPISGSPVPAKTYRGWPQPAQLQPDMRSGIVNINVWRTAVGRSTTRYPMEWVTLSVPTPTVTLTILDDTVTVGGTVGAGQNAAIVVNGVGYVYAVQATDTLTSIATALATDIGNGATSSGPVITIPSATSLGVTVGTIGSSIQEVARQIRHLQVNIWAPTPAIRDAAAKLLVPALRSTLRLSMPDGSSVRVMTDSDGDDNDGDQKEIVYRRMIPVPVEYATTNTSETATVVVTHSNVTPEPAGAPVTSFDTTIGVSSL